MLNKALYVVASRVVFVQVKVTNKKISVIRNNFCFHADNILNKQDINKTAEKNSNTH